MTEIQLSKTNHLERIKSILVDSLNSDATKRAYGKALDDYIEFHLTTNQTGLNRFSVNAHIQDLLNKGTGKASVNIRLAAIKKFAYESLQNGFIDDVSYNGIKNIKGIPTRGKKLGNWLNQQSVEEMINQPNVETSKGLRDRAILAVMFGGGLRRNEVCDLRINQLQQREGRWIIVDIIGKRDKVRSVPIASWVKALIDNWLAVYESTEDDILFVSINKGDKITGNQLTGDAILKMIQSYFRITLVGQ